MDFLTSELGKTAYRKLNFQSSKSVFYLPGHRNTLDEDKGKLLEEICNNYKISMTHWAYYGWDESVSSTVPEQGEGYIRDWLSQAIDTFDKLTSGPQILVGYSMGGYLALALASARPDRVVAIIGLAAGLGQSLTEQATNIYGNTHIFDKSGKGFEISVNDDNNLPINNVLPIKCPIYLYHSLSDGRVSSKNCLEISSSVETDFVYVTYSKHSEQPHRLNEAEDKRWLANTIQYLSH